MSQFPLRDKCEAKAERFQIPYFTLLACDNFTVSLVRRWIRKAQASGTNPAKIAEAQELLKGMIKWRSMNPTQCKIPD